MYKVNTELVTSRLKFCYWDETMFEVAHQLWGNSDVARYIAKDGKFDSEQILAKLNAEIENLHKYQVQYWPIFTKEDDLVGCCGLRPRDAVSGTYEFGVHILPEFWYKGLAIEAALAVIDYARNRKFTKIFAGHHPNNVASKKVLAKLGFVPFSLESYLPTGLKHPLYVLDLS